MVMRGPKPHWLMDWLERHRSPVSLWLHIVGIPLTIIGLVVMCYQLAIWDWDNWWRPLVLFVAGYGLQYVGHVHEGNDMGEVIVVKRWLNLPYRAISPKYAKETAEAR